MNGGRSACSTGAVVMGARLPREGRRYDPAVLELADSTLRWRQVQLLLIRRGSVRSRQMVILLSPMDATPPGEHAVEPLITVRSAGRLLGVGRHVLYRAAELGELPILRRRGLGATAADRSRGLARDDKAPPWWGAMTTTRGPRASSRRGALLPAGPPRRSGGLAPAGPCCSQAARCQHEEEDR